MMGTGNENIDDSGDRGRNHIVFSACGEGT